MVLAEGRFDVGGRRGNDELPAQKPYVFELSVRSIRWMTENSDWSKLLS